MTIRRIEDGVLVRSYKSLDLSIANADALIFGGAAKEGGDIKVYRDAASNLQMSVDADAASNTKALDIYGGVVAQNYLTVGQTPLQTTHPFYVNGSAKVSANLSVGLSIDTNSLYVSGFGVISRSNNAPILPINIPITSPDAAIHQVPIRINGEDIIMVQATGDGSGGITDVSIGLYPGTTPATQAAAISDPAESIAANNAAIDSILAALRGIGLIAT